MTGRDRSLFRSKFKVALLKAFKSGMCPLPAEDVGQKSEDGFVNHLGGPSGLQGAAGGSFEATEEALHCPTLALAVGLQVFWAH